MDYCDYDTSRGYVRGQGLGCFKGIAKRTVHILYGDYDRETVAVYDECLKALQRNCRKHGYRTIRVVKT